jgi:hypothetical protein
VNPEAIGGQIQVAIATTPLVRTPAESGAFVAAEAEKWSKVIKARRIERAQK